ncbi:hypothetical protein SeMB42_g03644 [Synchytrium endobioticum]|uniref:TFIIS N-terminal domain-containing protein n=1 Tax=Synchytrium endobioticum TaxID=286115 RepID=A0A507D525_9FUNG|nr:hypothetical protein SeMB42_g03644 [Synchytrium endobioticum]
MAQPDQEDTAYGEAEEQEQEQHGIRHNHAQHADGEPTFDDDNAPTFNSLTSHPPRRHDAADAPEDGLDLAASQEFDDIFGAEEDGDEDMRENVDSLAGSDSEEEEERIRNLVIKKKTGAAPVRKRKDKSAADKSKKKRKRGSDDPEETVPMTEQELRDKEFEDNFKAILDKIRPKKTKKKAKEGEDSTETTYDDVAAKLREKMRNAARTDAQLHETKQVALEKDKLFETVRKAMQRKHLYDVYIDNEMLSAIKEWLEPLRPDGLLPSLNIQQTLMDGLAQMPITADHLRSSGVARVIKFYANPMARVSEYTRRKAQALLDRWTNLVLGRSMNYRDSRIEYRPVMKDRLTSPQKSLLASHANDESVYARRPTTGLPAFQYMPQVSLTDTQARKELPEHLSKLSRKLNNIGRTKGGPAKAKK